jgi:hypothetical protein
MVSMAGRRTSRAVVLSVLIVVAGLVRPAARQHLGAEPPRSLTVGILREDAVLIPFATFDGKTWRNEWPVPAEDNRPARLPRLLADVPREWWGGREPATRWEVLRANGVPLRVAVTGVASFETHCQSNVGLATDFISRVRVHPHNSPPPYAGIAATTPNVLTAVADVAKGSRDFQTINRLLPGLFARLEPEVWKDTRGSEFEPMLNGPLPVPQLVSVHASPLPSGTELFTFHARRDLPRGVNGKRSERVTAIVGWLARRNTSPMALLDARGSQSDVDGKGGYDQLIPRAALTIGGRTFWVGNAAGYEWETYFVIEVGRGTPNSQVTAAAGGC